MINTSEKFRWHPIDWVERIPAPTNPNQVLEIMAKNCNLDGKGRLTIDYLMTHLGGLSREEVEKAISYLESRKIIVLLSGTHPNVISFLLRINIDPRDFYSGLE